MTCLFALLREYKQVMACDSLALTFQAVVHKIVETLGGCFYRMRRSPSDMRRHIDKIKIRQS